MKIGNENIAQVSDDALCTNVFHYLKRIIMLDRSTRSNFDEVLKSVMCPNTVHVDSNLDEESDYENVPNVHPLDYFLLAFLSCNPFLCQVLCQKLFTCGLAIPILYPRFQDSPDHLEVLLLPLKSIILEWRDKKQGYEQDAASAFCHFVSFCRIGESEGCCKSKSKIINSVLNDVANDTFFNVDCRYARRRKRISNGVVEGSWYIPSGEDSDIFPHPSMILNLRGNSLKYDNQMSFLSSLSSVVVMMVEASVLNEKSTISFLKASLKKCRAIILLIDHDTVALEKQMITDCLSEFKKNITSQNYDNLYIMRTFSRSKAYHKNATDIRTELRSKIKKHCKDLPKRSFNDSLQMVFETIDVISVDEANIMGKDQAEAVYKHVENDSDTTMGKHVPLQGELWREWSHLLKKCNRPNPQLDDPMAQTMQLQHEMKGIRDKQYKLCLKPSSLMKAFIDALTLCHSEVRHGENISAEWTQYFLLYLKLLFDSFSRNSLPTLHENYKACCMAMNVHNDCEQNREHLQANAILAEEELKNASFGVQHLFREVGQMYEAVHQKPARDEMITKIKLLPKIMAALVLAGQPLELMDGDASNVPLSWVQAVLSEITKMVPHKKIFVVCVLGVQSSGKTTLLNTMFGLQFAVSAGRCTRGVYMQLVPVDDNNSLPYDYVCVIDTEGLRAPDNFEQDAHRDKELAALAIGLGDLTILNVKGENYSVMQDILQIYVQTFLRMKAVTPAEKNQRRCLLIHQNVSATSAKEKLSSDSYNLKDNLDKRTCEVAHQENIEGIERFDQVIMFDCQRDVHFIPSFWVGNLPMAYANPGYSGQVLDIRKKIFSDIATQFEDGSFMIFEDFSQR